MWFMAFSNHETGVPRQGISKWSTVCSTFSRNGWSVVRSGSLAKGGTSKKRPSPHLHKVPTRCNRLNPRTLQTALVYKRMFDSQLLWSCTYLKCRTFWLTRFEIVEFVWQHLVRPFIFWSVFVSY
jgi:hypothetical protein